MAQANVPLYAFNRGIISALGLARTDQKRMALSAEVQTNYMPRVLGSMMLRPGLQYITSTLNNAKTRYIPFIFAITDTALLECTDSTLRPLVSEAPVTRVSVGTAVQNGTFATGDLTDWTNADQSGATSSYSSSPVGVQFLGTGLNFAIERQTLTVAAGDQGKEHALRVVVFRGPVYLRIGSTDGGTDYIEETQLRTGTHSIAFTPSGNAHVQISGRDVYPTVVTSVSIEAAGALTLPTPWALADLPNLRWDQSADVIFVACDGHPQQRIERHATRSWSVVTYETNDGPFLLDNITPTTITPSGDTGTVTLTASSALFQSGHVGAIFRIGSVGQVQSSALAGATETTGNIKVVGVGSARTVSINISGTWVGTIKLQYSVAAPGAWVDVPNNVWTANIAGFYLDGLDNQVIYYQLVMSAYTSGSATATLSIASGSIVGVGRITAVSSPTSATCVTVQSFGNSSASAVWSEGSWSGVQGYPTSVGLYEGRLWWAGRDNIWGSVSDAFDSFDDTTVGDSGPINRTLGSGPVDVINWLLPLQRLLIGAQSAEKSARSSSFDSPLTPTDFILKDASTQGSAAIPPVKIDFNGVFVNRSNRRVYQLTYSPNFFMMDYTSSDLTKFVPDLAIPAGGINWLAVQRQPDTRVHALLNDGTAAVLVYDSIEDVQCWVRVETAGTIEDVVVLPGPIEDYVYYVVNRTINGQTVRYLEKWAREDESWGNPVGKCADSFVHFTSGTETTSVTGLSNLEGQSVVAWGWDTINPFTVTMPDGTTVTVGRDLGTYTVKNGAITLTTSVTDAVVGLPYTAQFQSAKLAYAAQLGTGLTKRKRVTHIGLILANTHAQGIEYGRDFSTLDQMPLTEAGFSVDQNTVWGAYDYDAIEFSGQWSTDERMCLQSAAPRPCTVLAAVVDLETREST